MSKKSKTSEINDIIDSSYAEPDYDEEIDNHRYRNTYRSSYDIGSDNINPFSKISTTRSLAPANTSQVNTNTSNNSNTSNIFMKYTSPKTNTEIGNKNAITSTATEIKNTEEEFPSLGGVKKTTIQRPASMNFKKIVETKQVAEVQPQLVQKKPKCDDYSTRNHRLKVYEEVKYYSERTARSKIHRSGYSDNDDDDDDEYVDDYHDDE